MMEHHKGDKTSSQTNFTRPFRRELAIVAHPLIHVVLGYARDILIVPLKA